MPKRPALVALVLTVGSAALVAQERPEFDVVSIKRVEPGRGAPPLVVAQMASLCSFRANRFTCTGTTALSLIQIASPVDGAVLPQSQIIAGPDWLRTMQFNITATVTAGQTITPTQLPLAVRALLEDRFKFEGHTEPHSFPAYALVMARRDGPRLHPATTDCPAPPRDAPARLSGQCFSGIFRQGTITSGSITMETLARNLTTSGGLDRIVVDRTGLQGKYQVDLHWSPDLAQQSDDPLLVTALQEQLGLKLESRDEMLSAVIVDHIERPNEN